MRIPAAIIAIPLVAACDKPAGKAGPEPLVCAEGWLEDDGACVPEACGVGTWGELPVDEATVYVDALADAGGDGSADAPLAGVQAGLDLAGSRGGGQVAVAAGTYAETLSFGTEHGGVQLAGRCQDLVILDASGASADAAGIALSTAYGEASVSGVTVTGSSYTGILAGSGYLRLADLRVEDGSSFGIVVRRASSMAPCSVEIEGAEVVETSAVAVLVYGAGTEVTMRDVLVQDTRPDASGGGGYGIDVFSGAVLTAERCTLIDNGSRGFVANGAGTEAVLMGSVVRGTSKESDGSGGFGVEVSEGAELRVERCQLIDNAIKGLQAVSEDTVVTVVDSTVRGNFLDGGTEYGCGLDARDGAQLSVERCVVDGNGVIGLSALGAGSEATLVDSQVLDTLPNAEGVGGVGVWAWDGAQIEVEGCVVDGNRSTGVLLNEFGTGGVVIDTVVSGTQCDGVGNLGHGVGVHEGAAVLMVGCEVVGNQDTGVLAWGEATRIVLQDTVVQDTLENEFVDTGTGEVGRYGYGLQAGGGAAVVAERCVVRGETAQGIVVYGRGTELTLLGSMISVSWYGEEDSYGIRVGDGATLIAEGSEVFGSISAGILIRDHHTRGILRDTVVQGSTADRSGQRGYGVVVEQGAALRASRCEVTGNRSVGLLVSGESTVAVIQDSSITETSPSFGNKSSVSIGIVAERGANVVAQGVRISGNEGPGLYSVVEGSEIMCHECSILDNEFAGAVAIMEGNLEIDASTISGTGTSANLGGGVGVYAANQWELGSPTVLLQDNVLTDNLVAGAWFGLGGSYQLTGNDISGNKSVDHGMASRCGDGVYAIETEAWDGSSGLLLEGNTFSGNEGAGVLLDEAQVSLVDNCWSENNPDLLAQGEACQSPPDEWLEVPENEICPVWDRPTCDLAFVLSLHIEEAEPGMPPPPSAFYSPTAFEPQPLHEPTELQLPRPEPSLARRFTLGD